MGFEFKAAEELRNRGVEHERIEKIYVIADEDAGARGVKTGRAVHFEARAGEAQNVAEEKALRPVVFARIDENRPAE